MKYTTIFIILCFIDVTITFKHHIYHTTRKAPWTACIRFNGTSSVLKCFRLCTKVFDGLYMFSRDVTTGICYCCDKEPGVKNTLYENISTEDKRETFITGNCVDNYKGYEYNNVKFCLRYEESLKTYHEAVDICKREGGDLIRVDSLAKHNIMRSFVERQRIADRAEVWVQGIRDSNLTWRYHDSTELDYTCLTGVSANSNSNYMRAKSTDNYSCADNTDTYMAFYLCEIYMSNV